MGKNIFDVIVYRFGSAHHVGKFSTPPPTPLVLTSPGQLPLRRAVVHLNLDALAVDVSVT
jgi:hypothetical protein